MSEKKKWKQVGSIREGRNGKLYIKLDDVSTLKNGDALQIEKPQDKLQRLYELGYLDEVKLEERLAKVPDYVKYEISEPPKDD